MKATKGNVVVIGGQSRGRVANEAVDSIYVIKGKGRYVHVMPKIQGLFVPVYAFKGDVLES